MLLVPTYIAHSAIHGLGVFADRDICEGELIWTQMDGFDVVFDDDFVDALPPPTKSYVAVYSYRERGRQIMPGDNDRYTNHSDCPNTIVVAGGDVIAAQPIPRGEEITIDYRTFDEKWSEKFVVIVAPQETGGGIAAL